MASTKKVQSTRTVSVDFGADTLTFEVGKLAPLADGSVMLKYGETVVLATAVVTDEPREGVDFFPLLVDYEERLYAAGKISGSRFIKREGRPSENAVLTARLIDRPIRPLFPKGYRNDVQVIITILSYDEDHDPDVTSIIAASAALSLSSAPFMGPIGAVRIGKIGEEFVINPTASQRESSTLDLVLTGTEDRVLMLEAGAAEVDEDTLLLAIQYGQKSIGAIIEAQKKIQTVAAETVAVTEDAAIHTEVKKYLGDKLSAAVRELDKTKREERLLAFEREVLNNFEGNYKQIDLKAAFSSILEREVREAILKDGHRPDGRGLDDIRPLSAEVGMLPRTHGSALFTRGQTQVLTIVTLGAPGDRQVIDTMEEEGEKRYMHHYNFPPFSTGEVRPMRTVSRREIGHGALAERALIPVLPAGEQFPYTIRLVSEVLASNGSSSMAAICGSTLALMDAGVPIAKPVAGIAIGLISQEPNTSKGIDEDYALLTDIQGVEDFAGDMDFKVAGTSEGVTAVQLDMKVRGISARLIEEALQKAKTAREKILDFFKTIIAEPRKELSPHAPRIYSVRIDPKRIGELIGPGGKVINGIIEECGGREEIAIDIEPEGLVMVSSASAEKATQALAAIEQITKEIEAGKTYEGTVTAIQTDRMSGKEIGAIVQLTPTKDGMVHISQIASERIEKVSDHVKVGQKVKVKVVDIDQERGRIALSMRDDAPIRENHPNFSDQQMRRPPFRERSQGRERDRFRRR